MDVGFDMASGRDRTSYLTIPAGALKARRERLRREHEQRIVYKYQNFEENYYLLRLQVKSRTITN